MTCTMKIGGVEIPVDGTTWERSDDRVDAAPIAVTLGKIEFTCDLSAVNFDMAAFRKMFDLPERPRRTLALHGFDGNGQPVTETVEVDEIEFIIVRRGKKRPGQWTDRTRAKRHKRLMRAAEKRVGVSRRGLRRGFPIVPYRPLSSIHAECAELLRKADARLLEQTFNDWLASDPHVAAGVRMRIERPEGEP